MALTKVGLDLIDASGKGDDKYLKGDGTWGTIAATDTSVIEDDIALLGFKVAANGSFGKYNLVDQTEDAFMDATGIDASASTNEIRKAANYYSGATTPTGGTITSYSDGGTDYKVHSFLADGVFTTGKTASVDYLAVGGGGGSCGGSAGAGGGGAGGFRTDTGFSIAAAAHAITVGDGGAAGTGSDGTGRGGDGEDSVFSTITSTGGGGGAGGLGSVAGVRAGETGGSGGGGRYAGAGGAGNTPSTSPSQGNNGGGSTQASDRGGGGGGGAGAVGADGTSSVGGNGGIGTANSLRTNVAVTYAGGGGGGALGGTPSTGGAGGGGNGQVTGGSTQTGGSANTGGGAGANGDSVSAVAGAAGGSGIVVIRYVDGAFDAELDMTLVSNATTANDGAPTKGDIVMTYTNGVGTATLNTDLTAEFSANDGVAWTPMTLVAQGSTGTHLIVSAHNVTLTTASGTAMRYRIKTLNQGAAKETRIQAASLGWS